MKYAEFDGKKIIAKPGLIGHCPSCGSELIPRCGNIKIHHWAHKSKKMCDNWWENETQWHRDWKNHFPNEWQEVVQIADDGEKHIADVKTKEGWVVEFQHSYLKHEERESRNKFYNPNLIWIVDGGRRKRDLKQFLKILDVQNVVRYQEIELFTNDNLLNRNTLIEEWGFSKGFVFFDFSKYEKLHDLWLLIAHSDLKTYLVPIAKEQLLQYLIEGNFVKLNQTILSIKKVLIGDNRNRRKPFTVHLDYARMRKIQRIKGRNRL